MLSPIYVIGHLNPDTDAIASAMGYAWLLRERDGNNAIAARAGAVNPQTAWVLKMVGLEPPPYMADASPRFERIARTLPPILPDRPLREAWAVAAWTSTATSWHPTAGISQIRLARMASNARPSSSKTSTTNNRAGTTEKSPAIVIRPTLAEPARARR